LGSAAVRKKTIRIFQPDVFVKLPKVHVVHLQPLQRFIELLKG